MRNKLFKNIGFLTISQMANYVIPLVTIPYVTRIVGPEKFGLLEFATVSMAYLSAVVIFGFNTTATRKIAEKPSDSDYVSKIFSTVLITRIFLFILMILIFLIVVFTIPEFANQKKLMFYAFPIVLGWALYPDFLFQGIQKLEVLAISNFAIKALAAISIFTLLNSANNFYYVAGINSAAQVLVGVGILLFSFKLVPGLKLVSVKRDEIIRQLKEGVSIFLSQFFSRVYTFSSIIFLGFLLSNQELGLYSAGLKLVVVAQSFLFLPLFGALFPYLANLFAQDVKRYKIEFNRALRIMLLISILSVVVILIFPEFFMTLVFGAQFVRASYLLQIMSPILITTAITHFCLQQGLIIFKKDNWNLMIVICIGVISLILNYVFIKIYGLEGAAWVKVLVDLLFAMVSFILFRKAFKELSQK